VFRYPARELNPWLKIGKTKPAERYVGTKGSSVYERLKQCQSGDCMKRIGDLLIAFILIAFTLPLMSIVVLAIKLDTPGPIFCRHECLGLRGRRVKLLKFRTTARKLQDPNRMGIYDAPVTRVGRFLRFARIDDLPQLINVVRGELTLIGAGKNRPAFFGWW